MFERFTGRATRTMDLAHTEAARLRHEYVGTEHILLGLVAEGPGVAAHVFDCFGVTLDSLRSTVEQIVHSGPAGERATRLWLSPRAKHVVKVADEEARRMGHNYICTEHLFLGVCLETGGVGAETLRASRVDPEYAAKYMRGLFGDRGP